MDSFPISQLPLRSAGPVLIPFFFFFKVSLSLTFFLAFVLPSYLESFLPFLEVSSLLPAFIGSSVRIILHAVFLFFIFDVVVGEGEHHVLLLCHL